MIALKNCPKCHGDLYRDTDPYVDEMVCLQCGYRFAMRLANSPEAMLYPPKPVWDGVLPLRRRGRRPRV